MWIPSLVQVWNTVAEYPSRPPVPQALSQVKAPKTIHRGLWTMEPTRCAQRWAELVRRRRPVGKNPVSRAGSGRPRSPVNAGPEPILAPVRTRTRVIHRG
ncbi:hypothetical protein JCM9957A_31120 [Kineosporia succinea]